MYFYYHFVSPNKSLLAIGRNGRVKDIIRNQFNTYVGDYWELFCRTAVSGNELEGHNWMMAKRWWGTVLNEKGEQEQVEFDVVAESDDKKYLLIGECKWQKPDYAERLLAELKRKSLLVPFIGKHKVIYALFLKNKPTDEVDAPVFLPDDVLPYC